MAYSNAERQRRYRERVKARLCMSFSDRSLRNFLRDLECLEFTVCNLKSELLLFLNSRSSYVKEVV